MRVKFRKLHPEAQVPQYQSEGAAGLDLHARIGHEIHLQPGVRFTCPTGIAIELPVGFEAQIRPRSGLAIKNGITVINSPGTIDSDYRGEICVLLVNHSDRAFTIEPGMRIAQMVVAPVTRIELVREMELSETERGANGMGSTGTWAKGFEPFQV